MVSLVKIEGTLDEIKELIGDVKRTAKSVKGAVRKTVKTAKKAKRKLSKWQKYIATKRNQIKFRNGRLNLKKMAVAFRKLKR